MKATKTNATEAQIMPLALRPHRFSQLVGQDRLTATIQKQMAARPPAAFLFYGGTGCGKTSIARILAVSLQCTHGSEFGEPCEQCWERWNEFSIHEVNASQANGVEEAERLATLGQYAPNPPGRKRVIILDEAHRMTDQAQNLLLKSFEEPARHTVWIICTTLPSKILATLRRRCMSYELRPLGIEQREQLLRSAMELCSTKRPLQALVDGVCEAQLASPALLLMALEKYLAGASVSEAVTGVETAGLDTLAICKAVTNGEWARVKTTLQNVAADDVRVVRAAVSGWLCGCLKRESSHKRQLALACSIEDLTEMAPFDGALPLHWLWAKLLKICRRLRPEV